MSAEGHRRRATKGKAAAKRADEPDRVASSLAPTLAFKDVTTRGARVRFVEAGRGAPLLLVHDALATHATFLRAIAHLAQSFRVIAPDLPGFGGSEKPEPQRYAYGYDAFADSLFDLVAGLDLGRVHVCGHGMGGSVALTLAARFPALVHKLIVVDAPVYEGDEHPFDSVARIPGVGSLLWMQLMGSSLFHRYLKRTVYAGAAQIPAESSAEAFATFNAPAARQAAQATIIAKADTRSVLARLPRITAETLVVWGRDDALGPVEHGRRLARELRGRFVVLECGRCAPEELPEAFSSTVTSFLASPPPRRRARSTPRP